MINFYQVWPGPGRDVEETLRVIHALQFNERHGDVCPAGWQTGGKAMTTNAKGLASFLADNASSLLIKLLAPIWGIESI